MATQEEKHVRCILCIEPCETEFTVVDNDMIKMMALLLIRRDPKEQDIICFKCTDNLKTCFEFKSSCLCLKNSADPFANEKGNAKQHLFFPTKKGCSSDILPESHSVCCLCTTSNGHDWYISLANNKSNINLKVQLNKYFPEFILSVTEDLAICTACNVSLADFLKIMDHWSNIWLNVVGNNTDMIRTATKNCTDLNLIVQSNPKCEEDADNVCLKYEDQKSTNPESLLTTNPFDFVKLERQELSIKHEEIDIEMSQDNNKRLGDYTTSSQLENAKMEETKSYQCDKCEFRAKHKSRLQQHMVMHLDPSKVTMYQCDRCEYKAKCKSYLKKHSVTHGDPPEVPIYQCDQCDHMARHKSNLKKHMMVHRDPSDVTMYQCDKCEYKAKHKSYLKKHMVNHQDPAEVIRYQCGKCDYMTKHKPNLLKHMVVHQDPSEVTTYRCDKCEYKGKHKTNLKKHMMIHQDPSEVILYPCDKCGYKAKHKTNLKKHMIDHKDIFEVTIYRCDKCEYNTRHKYYLKRHMVIHQ